MKPFLILALSGLLAWETYAQTIANGNFNLGVDSWGCNPETNLESVYGGASNTNTVAEVDAAAGALSNHYRAHSRGVLPAFFSLFQENKLWPHASKHQCDHERGSVFPGCFQERYCFFPGIGND